MSIADWFRPKWKHSDCQVRKAAVKHVVNQAVLTDIAMYDNNAGVRKAAVALVTDGRVLADIAKNDKESDVRRAAVKRVIDQGVLAEKVVTAFLSKSHQ